MLFNMALMKFRIFNFILFLLGSLTFVACAVQGNRDVSAEKYRPLTEEEKKKFITPTIYYIPQFDLSKVSCSNSSEKSLKDKSGQVMFRVCDNVYDACLLQGTCQLQTSRGNVLINVAGEVNSEQRFSKIQNKDCRFGLGAKSTCLDPFYTVAADLSIYKMGDVIFIPSVKGVELPDKSKHDGYFVVRDTGGSIKGYGRFDFFTGFMSWGHAENPFRKLDFGDKKTHVDYYVLEEQEALEILKSRNFPKIPQIPVKK